MRTRGFLPFLSIMVMAWDPWIPSNSSAAPPSSNTGSFEDDFVNPNALPDSAEYIASLERKLERLRKGRGTSSKNLLESLEERRQDCIARLLAEDLSLTSPEKEEFAEENVPTKWLKNYLNPEQALTVGELVELVKADYLAKETEKREGVDKEDISDQPTSEDTLSNGVEVDTEQFSFLRNMSKSKITGTKAFCLITGGSQGIGQCIALEFAKILAPKSKLCLTARSISSLKETAFKVKEVNPDIITEYVGCDLSKDFELLLKRLESFKNEQYDAFFLIHNAGSEGKGTLTKDMDNVQYWQEYMALNVYSMTALTSAFLKIFPTEAPRTLVNITSLAAIAPFKGLGYYCVGKAAREMYLKVLAEENPDLRILNYSPGCVKTDMIARVINNVGDPGTKESFVSMRDENKLIEPADTIGKMIRILDEGSFTSGSRVDYYD